MPPLHSNYVWSCCQQEVLGPRLGTSELILEGPCPRCRSEAEYRQLERRTTMQGWFFRLLGRSDVSPSLIATFEDAVRRGHFPARVRREAARSSRRVSPASTYSSHRFHPYARASAENRSLPPVVSYQQVMEAGTAMQELGIRYHALGDPLPNESQNRLAPPVSPDPPAQLARRNAIAGLNLLENDDEVLRTAETLMQMRNQEAEPRH